MKNYLTINISNIFLLSVLLLVSSGCSKHPPVEEGKHDTYHKRSYTTAELQKRYEHILKGRKQHNTISETRSGLRKSTKDTFGDINAYKKKLDALSAARKRGQGKNRRFGKNVLSDKGVEQPKYVYTEGCSKDATPVSLEGARKKDIDLLDKELTKYY